MTKTHRVNLHSNASTTFRCAKAANSLDIDIEKKLSHTLEIVADLDTPFNVGLIVGSSGSGKTTLAKQVWGNDIFAEVLDLSLPVIDQFPAIMNYDDCASALNGVGLSQVPCWIRPAHTLSNGQRFRAEIALQMAQDREFIVIDEWTSVVDRTVAKAMSFCVQKHARRTGKRIVLLSCHHDVIEWVEPDWIIDCNLQTFDDRRLLRPARQEKLHFEIRLCERSAWKFFSRYHYLSENLPAGDITTYGLFIGETQIGFQCFANYVPHVDKSKPRIMHSNRTVIHPDYVGFGLGIALINATSFDMIRKGYIVMAKFSSVPVYKALLKHPDLWRLEAIERHINLKPGELMDRKTGFRNKVKTYRFRFIGKIEHTLNTCSIAQRYT